MPKHDDSQQPTDDQRHADHIAGKHHHKYDPKCDDCRVAAQEEYKRKLASGELNRIEFLD